MAVYKNDYGLWSVRIKYKDNDGKWKQKMAYSGKSGFSRKKEALEKEQEIVIEIENELLKLRDPNNWKTFEEVKNEALIESRYYMKETSIKGTMQSLQHANSLNEMCIGDITTQDLRKIMVSLEQKNLSLATIDKIYYKMNFVFKYALENEYIQTNPLLKVKRIKKPDQLDEKTFNVWKLSEFQEYIKNVKNPMYYTLFSLLYYSGMRRGEALALQWEDIDLDNGTIHIKKTLSNIYPVSDPHLTPPKTKNSVRLIHMPKVLHEIMIKWYEHESIKYHYGGKAFVFGFTNPLARNTVYNQFRKHLRIGTNGFGYTDKNSLSGKLEVGEVVMLHGKVYYNLDKLGGYKEFNIHVEIIDIIENANELNYVVMINLPYLRLHDLRHSCVSLMINNIKTQQSFVAMAHHFGHSVETMIKVYSHFFTETEQALIHEFDGIIDNEMRK